MYLTHCIFHMASCMVNISHGILNITLFKFHLTHVLHFIYCNLHIAVYPSHFTHCTLYIVLYTLHFTLCTLHIEPYTLHSGCLHLDPAQWQHHHLISSSQVLAREFTPGPVPAVRKVKVCMKGKVKVGSTGLLDCL